jgi:hypothetical protein
VTLFSVTHIERREVSVHGWRAPHTSSTVCIQTQSPTS